MEKNSGIVEVIVVMVLAIVIFAIVFSVVPKNQAVIEADARIDPQSFKNSHQSVLTLSLKNNDQASAHDVRLRFLTYHLVHLFIGSSELASEEPDSGNYTFDISLHPAQKTEQPFIVKVSTLPQGIANQKFSLKVEVYTNGNLITTKEVKFDVEED